jgi:hypothetical protein
MARRSSTPAFKESAARLEALVLRALARDPVGRYPSALALAHDLERALAL